METVMIKVAYDNFRGMINEIRSQIEMGKEFDLFPTSEKQSGMLVKALSMLVKEGFKISVEIKAPRVINTDEHVEITVFPITVNGGR